MKNNLLLEIEHMKKLMGLNEASNQECEKQLEKAGYQVYNRTELKSMDIGCKEKPMIKCVIEWLTENGFSEDDYTVSTHKGYCYLLIQSDNLISHELDGKKTQIKARTWTFWDNGDVTYIRTFDDLQKDEDEDPTVHYAQAQYKGKYTCEDDTIKNKNMSFLGMYKFNDKRNLIEKPTFKIKDSSENVVGKVMDLITTNRVLTKSDITG
jgi:hypothetical protein